MKKIAIPALAALIACPAMAGQNHQYHEYNNSDIWNPYLALRVGAGYTNHNYDFNGKKDSMNDEEMHGRVALGLQMYDTARTEIEWSLFTKMKDNKDFGAVKDVEIKTELQTLLMNAYMDLGNFTTIRPFVGVGAGIAFSEVSREVPGLARYKQDKDKFSAMGTMGVSFDWNIFAVDMAFRYTYADLNAGFHNFGGDIGVRYMF